MIRYNFLRTISNKNLFEGTDKKIGLDKATKKYFHESFFSKAKKNARKGSDHRKKLQKMKYTDHLKIIVVSSIYFFTADYLYHVLLLKDWNKNKTDKNDISNEVVVEQKNKTLFTNVTWKSLFDWRRHCSSKERKKEEETNKDSKEIEDPDEIKITHINKKPIYAEDVGESLVGEKPSTGSSTLDLYSSNQNDYNEKEKNKDNTKFRKNDSLYKNIYNAAFFLNGCDLFLIVNGFVFVLWRISMVIRDQRLFQFMSRHFICSYENVKKKYVHTIITSSISHITVPHFLFNMWAFYTLSNTLLLPEVKQEKRNYFFFNYKSNVVEQKMKDLDIINVCALSSIFSTVPYILLNKRNKLLGASGCLMGLIYILSTVKPNEQFVTIFPLPYIKLTALQLCHISILTNFLFLFFKKSFGIAWSAHLFGFLGGVVYNLYQRTKQNYFYYPFIELSIKNGSIDYQSSYLDFLDWLTSIKLQITRFFSSDDYKKYKISKQLNSIQYNQTQRRMKFTMQKVKNLEEMSRPVDKENT